MSEDIIIEEKQGLDKATGNTAMQETTTHKHDPKASGNRRRLLNTLWSNDEEADQEILHLKDMLQALSIDGMWFRRHIGMFLLILAGIILYITNRYKAQMEMIEEVELRAELQDWKYRSMTVSSDLTTKCRQSLLERRLKALGDSTLQISKTPPYEIKKK